MRLPDGLDQRAVMQAMLDAGIATRRGIMCAHREACYAGTGHASLVHSEAAQDHCIILPLYPADDRARAGHGGERAQIRGSRADGRCPGPVVT